MEIRSKGFRLSFGGSDKNDLYITKVSVTASKTVAHPTIAYSNAKPSLTLEADIPAGADFEAAVKFLQEKANSLLDCHSEELLRQVSDSHAGRRPQQKRRANALSRLGGDEFEDDNY